MKADLTYYAPKTFPSTFNISNFEHAEIISPISAIKSDFMKLELFLLIFFRQICPFLSNVHNGDSNFRQIQPIH